MGRCDPWSQITEPATSGWSQITEPAASQWSAQSEPEPDHDCYAIDTDLEITQAGLGLVVKSPGGLYYRIGVDNDGAVTSTAVGAPSFLASLTEAKVCARYTEDFYIVTASKGILIKVLAQNQFYRIRVDDDGALVSEAAGFGWVCRPDVVLLPDASGGSAWSEDDVYIVAEGAGLVLTTPDGTKRYRIRIDTDGAITSDLI